MKIHFSSIFGYFLFYIFFIFLTIFYKNSLFLFFLMFMITLPIISYILTKEAVRKLSLSPNLPTECICKDSADVNFTVHNSSYFPIPNCEIVFNITSSFYPSDETVSLSLPVFSHKDSHTTLPVRFERSACYSIIVKNLQIVDYLHFFTFTHAVSAHSEILVFPKEETLNIPESAVFSEGFDDTEETDQKGIISSNVTDVRPFIDGDRLSRIHWKLSERFSSLFVRENEHTQSKRFTVFVELFNPQPASDYLEKSLSAGFNAALFLLNNNETFFFCYYREDISELCQHFVSCREELEGALRSLFYAPSYLQESLGLTLIQNTGLIKGCILYATHKGVEDVEMD